MNRLVGMALYNITWADSGGPQTSKEGKDAHELECASFYLTVIYIMLPHAHDFIHTPFPKSLFAAEICHHLLGLEAIVKKHYKEISFHF